MYNKLFPEHIKTVQEFKDYCNRNDYNIVDKWDFSRFQITCKDCNSSDIIICFKNAEYAGGSEYTGTYKYEDNGVLVKCKSCGRAMSIRGI